jgi:hypothetical protein
MIYGHTESTVTLTLNPPPLHIHIYAHTHVHTQNKFKLHTFYLSRLVKIYRTICQIKRVI